MRELGGRLLIGLAVAAVTVMAVGYTFIFGGIATPLRGDRATLDLPAEGDAAAVILDDGRPAFIVNDPAVGVWVLDAQARQPAGALAVLVAWCSATRTFADAADGSLYAPNGELLFGPAEGGLVAFASRPAADDPSRVIVGSDTSVQSRATANGSPPSPTCPDDAWVAHAPQPGEIFDPSVAVDQEAPGWIWLEGSLGIGDDGIVRLCDPGSGAVACERSAQVVGIDPALLGGQGGPPEGRFIGRVRDDAVEGLIFVPNLVEGP